ncbi:MinD/ParA family protein [Mycolicibacterium vaccae]|nr:MinD/ParA family protein [Mycolicibacterium vaccae]
MTDRSVDTGDSLVREQLTPQFGWRRVLYRATKGRVNPGVSQKDREQQALLEQIRQPIASDFRIAVLSIKGGVGKTTTTIGLGSAFAMVRSDRVIAVDANPDRGTLAERISDPSTSSTVRDLLLDPDISRYADVRRHTRLAPSRLEVLASVQDPAVAEIFGESDYRRTIEILQAHYNIILTDCGTGIMHSSMASVLDLAHALVLVSSPAVDAARSAVATLDWLTQHGYGRLARESHVVLSGAQTGSQTTAFAEVFQYFEARSGSIHVVPFEPHLARGADVDFAMLSPDAVRTYLELAGAVATKFSRVG